MHPRPLIVFKQDIIISLIRQPVKNNKFLLLAGTTSNIDDLDGKMEVHFVPDTVDHYHKALKASHVTPKQLLIHNIHCIQNEHTHMAGIALVEDTEKEESVTEEAEEEDIVNTSSDDEEDHSADDEESDTEEESPVEQPHYQLQTPTPIPAVMGVTELNTTEPQVAKETIEGQIMQQTLPTSSIPSNTTVHSEQEQNTNKVKSWKKFLFRIRKKSVEEAVEEAVEATELPTVEESGKGKPPQETPSPSNIKGSIDSKQTDEHVGHASTTVGAAKELNEEEHFLSSPSTRIKIP